MNLGAVAWRVEVDKRVSDEHIGRSAAGYASRTGRDRRGIRDPECRGYFLSVRERISIIGDLKAIRSWI